MMNSNNVKHIFFDLDNTLWDFSANSKVIVEKLFYDFDLPGRGIKILINSFLTTNNAMNSCGMHIAMEERTKKKCDSNDFMLHFMTSN